MSHLLDLGAFVRLGVLLDTHVALEDEATAAYDVGGRRFRYRWYAEGGLADVFSGTQEHSKWLTLDDIIALLREAGFGRVTWSRGARRGTASGFS